MINIFNKKIESKFIDKLLVKFYIFMIFFMPIIVLFSLLLNNPYKEILKCNSNKCTLEQRFLFTNSNVINIDRPTNIKIHIGGNNRLKSYSLIISEYKHLFSSPYYIPYFAYNEKDLIESNTEKIKITKYNGNISLLLNFNIMLVIILIIGRIRYIKKHNNKFNKT